MPADVTISRPDLRTAKTILAIQPHYDDNDLGAGGTLAALSRHGARVIYLTVTDDQVGVLDPALAPDQAETALRGEQAQAGRLIGVHEQRWLGYPDAGPIDYYKLREDVIVAIRELRPDVIFTVDPWLPYEFHQDHVLTGRAATEAIGLYAFRRLSICGKIDRAYQPHPLRAVAYYFTHTPNTFFDVTETHELKMQAVRCYRLQFTDDAMEDQLRRLELDARQAAAGRRYRLAEALKVLGPTDLHIQTETWRR
jgi:N,N'-diacetylchitobiose non-reducing end deacetylase